MGKRRHLVIIVLLVFIRLTLTAQQQHTYTKEEKPWVWWFWMGNIVTHESIQATLQSFQHSGFGGVTIISTYGVKGFEKSAIPFRSNDWFKQVSFAIHKAAELGMGVDLAFSSAWPYGGPSVTMENAAKKLKGDDTFYSGGGELNMDLLKARRHDKDRMHDFVVAAAAFSGYSVRDLTPNVSPAGILHTQLPKAEWNIQVLYAAPTMQMVKRSSPGGEGLVLDPFSPQATLSYLKGFDSTADKLKGVRSAFNDSYEVYGADYTPGLFQAFQDKRGYSLVPYFHLLFDSSSSGMRERVLCDYRETMAELLEQGFVNTWIGWNRAHHFQSTEQAHGSPGNLLDLYGAADIPQTESFGPSHFNIPGVRTDPDVKRDRIKWPDKLMFKFASSAAHVNGRTLCSAETATWLTNHFRLALSQLKPQVDELFVSGVNHIMLISATNTPRNVDFPGWVFYPAPDFGSYAPFYNYLPSLSAYVSRCQHYLQQSTPDNDILVYFPVYDYWSEAPADLGVLAGFDQVPTRWGDHFGFSSTIKNLWKNGFSFDYISDRQIKQLTVSNGQLVSSGNNRYKVILIPSCHRIPTATMESLLLLARQGVPVLFEDSIPADVPGWNNLNGRRMRLRELTRQMSSLPNVRYCHDITTELLKEGCIKESFQANGLQFIRKNYKDGKLYFIANLDSTFNRGRLKLGTAFESLLLIDPLSGKEFQPHVETKDGSKWVDLELFPGQSCLLLTNSSQDAQDKFPYINKEQEIRIKGNWKIQFEKNGFMSPPPMFTRELKSWTDTKDSATRYFCGTAIYSTQFDLPEDWKPAGISSIEVSGLRDMAEITINGHLLGKTWSVPFILQVNNRYLRKKRNQLIIRVTNLSTNHIIWMDRQHIPWKTFYIADPSKPVFDASGWELQPSGITGAVRLYSTKY